MDGGERDISEYGSGDSRTLDESFKVCDDVSDVFQGRIARNLRREAYCEMISELASWSIFGTLTFKNEVSPGYALSCWRKWLQEVNTEEVGKRYSNYVGHSFFSYVLGVERQSRGVLHFHFLASKGFEFYFARRVWENMAGYCWFGLVRSQAQVARYISKYIVKGGEVEIYRRP